MFSGSLMIKNRFSYTPQLLIKADGGNLSTTFIDSSPQNNAIQVVGNTKISTDNFVYGGSSARFYSTSTGVASDMLRINSSTISISEGAFTVEAFIFKIADINYSRICNWNTTWSTNASLALAIDPLNKKILLASFLRGTPLVASITAILNNRWYHVAISRDGDGMLRLFIDGVQESNIAMSTSLYIEQATPFLTIGGGDVSVGGFSPFTGFIDSFCLTPECKYTSNFDPFSSRNGLS